MPSVISFDEFHMMRGGNTKVVKLLRDLNHDGRKKRALGKFLEATGCCYFCKVAIQYYEVRVTDCDHVKWLVKEERLRNTNFYAELDIAL